MSQLVDYRIQVTATKGEQLVVERQYQTSPNLWVTVAKYMTDNLSKLPKKCQPWMLQVPAMFGVEQALAPAIQIHKAVNAIVQAQNADSMLAAKLAALSHEPSMDCPAAPIEFVETEDPHVLKAVEVHLKIDYTTADGKRHSETHLIDKEEAEKILPSIY